MAAFAIAATTAAAHVASSSSDKRPHHHKKSSSSKRVMNNNNLCPPTTTAACGVVAAGKTGGARHHHKQQRMRTVVASGELSWDEEEEIMHMELGNETAAISVEVRDKYTAEVKVTAPDRPRLLQDVCSALTGNKFSIDSASIVTNSDAITEKTFVIKLADGGDTFEDQTCFYTDEGEVCQTMLEKVKVLILEAAIDSWTISNPVSVAYVAPEDQVVETEVSVIEVETSIEMKSGKCMMVALKTTDRAGLLATITAALQKVNAKVISASVMTKEGAADNKFVIVAPDGCSIEAVRVSCMNALK